MIEVAATLLNAIILLVTLILLARRRKGEVGEQIAEIDQKVDLYGTNKPTAWQNANSNMNFNKSLQWNYLYYIVLLYAAIIALSTQYDNTFVVQLLLVLGTNAVLSIGLYLTIDIQFQIMRERLSIISIKILLTEDAANITRTNRSLDQSRRFLYNPLITMIAIGTNVIGYAISLYLVMRITY